MSNGEMIALGALVIGQAGAVVGYLLRLEARLARIETKLGTNPDTGPAPLSTRRR